MKTMTLSAATCGVIATFAVGFVLSVPNAIAAGPDAATSALLAKYSCTACHTPDKKLVGPSYQEIAAKYAGDKTAAAKLEQKVKNGGSGVWGAIPMPPNNVPDADLKTMVAGILATK